MSEIAFHFGAPDKWDYACRLLRKAVHSGARLLVLVPPGAAPRLDARLWALSPTDFLPHCDDQAAASVQQRSRVVIVQEAGNGTGSGDRTAVGQATGAQPGAFSVLLNLSHQMPEDFTCFPRVIEVVSLDEQDRTLARQRWKRYTELGYPIQRHDLKLKGSA